MNPTYIHMTTSMRNRDRERRIHYVQSNNARDFSKIIASLYSKPQTYIDRYTRSLFTMKCPA